MSFWFWYNPLGIEMAVSLGRPKPLVPQEFMKPDEERQIYSMFGRIIEEKGARRPALETADT
jgi:hypothetical protein